MHLADSALIIFDMRRITFLIAIIATLIVFPQQSSAKNDSFALDSNQAVIIQEIDKYINKVMEEWQLPGLAAAFAIGDETILEKGYGTKEYRPTDGLGLMGVPATDREITTGGYVGVVNTPGAPIDKNTLFHIGSVSKSFTATLIADLIDEGKLSWEDTVANILPDFKMYDPWVTANMQVKDVMTHRTGLGGQVGTYIPNLGYDRDDVYKMFHLLKPKYSFRGDYQYNNITFIIAEKIIEEITGKSWEENLRERIFEPLGMNSTSMNAEGYATARNVATPHDYSFKSGRVKVMPLYGDEQAQHWLTVIGPAGSIISNVSDMTKYATMHKNNGWAALGNSNGTIDTVRIMSEKAMRDLHKGITITSHTGTRTTSYANCWFVEQNNRYRVYFHTGTTWGMTALCFFVPEIDFSGVILVNSEASSSPRYAIMNRAIDLLIANRDGKNLNNSSFLASLTDYSKNSFKLWFDGAKERELEAIAKSKENTPDKKPALLEPESFVGIYKKDELFGDAQITLEGGDLYITIGKKKFKNKLTHKNGAEYSFRSDGHTFPIKFNFNKRGTKVKGFVVEFNYGEEETIGGWRR